MSAIGTKRTSPCALHMSAFWRKADIVRAPSQGTVFAATMSCPEPRGDMRRREFIAFLGGAAAAWPIASRAEQPAIPLIGIINAGSAASTAKGYEAFRSELKRLGYVEGRNIRFEFRFADGFLDRLPHLAEEMVRLNPAIIVSAPVPANMAVHQATKTIPIVMSTGADPSGSGWCRACRTRAAM